MIDRREILDVARDLGLEARVVEKDYVLGWLLAGIYSEDRLRASWVFKGGTCLKKCYFETYRFSEDLDFTLTDESHLDSAFLVSAFATSLPGSTIRQASRFRPASYGSTSSRIPGIG